MTVLSTPGLQESIDRGWPRAWLVYVDHPDGEVWLWSGIGVLNYADQDYEGLGRFGRVTQVGGSKRLALKLVAFELSGVPPRSAQSLSAKVRNRAAKAWVAGLDSRGGRVNGEPFLVVDGLADYQELELQGGTAVIRLHIGEPVYSIERAQNRLWTPEWARGEFGQHIAGFDKISGLVNAEKTWSGV